MLSSSNHLTRRFTSISSTNVRRAITPANPPQVYPSRLFSSGTDGIVSLPSSRKFAYRSYGPSTGSPIFLFHGTPGSRFDAEYFLEHLEPLNIRLIGVDRPGYGLSTPDPTRRILDYPNDILHLANHLSLNKFSVAGISGGGPYVLACAHSLPRSRLVSASVIAGAGDVHRTGISKMGLDTYTRLSLFVWTYFPRWFSRSLAYLAFKIFVPTHNPEKLEAASRKAISKMKEGRVKETFQKEHILQANLNSVINALSPGLGGYYTDCDLMSADWGFSMKNIRDQPDGPGRIILAYGTRDTATTVEQARHLIRELGGNEIIGLYGDGSTRSDGPQLRVYEGESHGSLFTGQGEDLLKEILGK